MHTNSGKKVFHAIIRCHCTSEHSSHSSLSKAVRFHECGTLRYAQAPSGALRYGQAPSGALRYAQVPSETLCFNVGPTVHKRLKHHNSRNCHNRLKSHGHPPLFQRSSTAPTAPRMDALLRFPSPNPPTFREEPKKSSEKTLQIAITVLALN